MSACIDCPRFNVQTRRTRCCCEVDLTSIEERKQEIMAAQGLVGGNRKSRRAAEARSRRA